MEYYHLMFSIHVVFDIVFVITISRMNYVIERGCWLWSNLHGVTEMFSFVMLLSDFLLLSFLG